MAKLSMESAYYECNPTKPGFRGPYQELRWIDPFKASMSIMDTNCEVFKNVEMIVMPHQQETINFKAVPSQGTFRVLDEDFGLAGVRPRSIVVEIVETAVDSVDPCDRIKSRWLFDAPVPADEGK